MKKLLLASAAMLAALNIASAQDTDQSKVRKIEPATTQTDKPSASTTTQSQTQATPSSSSSTSSSGQSAADTKSTTSTPSSTTAQQPSSTTNNAASSNTGTSSTTNAAQSSPSSTTAGTNSSTAGTTNNAASTSKAATPSAAQSTTTQQPAAAQSTTSSPATSTASSPSSTTNTQANVSAGVTINRDQQTQISAAITTAKVRPETRVDFSINVGTVVPSHVHLYELPANVVTIVPQYRGYQYFMVRDEIVIIEPRTKKIVTVISSTNRAAATPSSTTKKVTFSEQDRAAIRKSHRATTGSGTRSSVTVGQRLPDDVELRSFDEEVYRTVPTVREYRYIDSPRGVYIVDPSARTVIEEID